MTITNLINVAVVCVVAFLLYYIASLVLSGVILQVIAILLVLIVLLYALRLLGIING